MESGTAWSTTMGYWYGATHVKTGCAEWRISPCIKSLWVEKMSSNKILINLDCSVSKRILNRSLDAMTSLLLGQYSKTAISYFPYTLHSRLISSKNSLCRPTSYRGSLWSVKAVATTGAWCSLTTIKKSIIDNYLVDSLRSTFNKLNLLLATLPL